eukprot:TRINITY_DN13232_c0_g1_i1.p2 TRINITY_DN13232_c0_g1~~TRINITY_DN13232_c0_g1_i1.p2  ORF type:complete len:449 (+),score=101.92 TRINITY_DN13232_c0_g1_i1:67-1413(+)
MARRAEVLLGHFSGEHGTAAAQCIGEMANRQVDPQENAAVGSVPKKLGQFVRIPLKIVFTDASMSDERYGGGGDVAILEGELLRPPTKSKTVLVFMHPSGIMNLLPMPVGMARAGLHVCTCPSRYPNNDTCCIMEKVVVDLGACIRYLKTKLGYEKVVLVGWSGGGSLSSFYQSQAESPTITRTPAGDSVDLTKARLIPADALAIMAAHSSRARIFTEWLDPAVLDERDPSKRDVELDLYDPRNPNQPPFTAEYVARFRSAQVARNRRITQWVRSRLQQVEREGGSQGKGWLQSQRDFAFNVHCTQADIRRIDPTVDPAGLRTQRPATPLHELAAENHSPVGLARYTGLRSWLSQWSYDESNADGPKSLSTVRCPVVVVANGSDHLVPLTHPRAMYDAVPHGNKEWHVVDGATHYYFGQRAKMNAALNLVVDWLRRQQLLEPAFTTDC